MKNIIFIVFVIIMAGEAYAVGNGSETATSTPLIIENGSPEAIFDQIKGFLTVPMPNLNIQVPTLETPNFDTSGIQNLNDQIRDIAGVDILRFLNFLWDIFLVLMRYLLELLSRAAG